MDKIQYKQYFLILLTLVATFNYLDRYVLSLVMESIKLEFQLSDSQLGFLTGMAFALFYAVAGVPIARWADRGNRNIIVSLSTGLWSVMLVFCGLVANYTQLLLARVGVAVGEAGCLPPAQSLIADYFDRAERPRAMAIYWLCGPLSVILGYLAGGWLAEYFGWRMTFIVMGVPGVALAILVKLTLREPRLKLDKALSPELPSFKAVLATLWQQQTFRSILLAFCVSYFFSMGMVQWMPTFFIRSYGMEMGELGIWFAAVWGGVGLLATLLGGFLASRFAARQEPLQMRACALIVAIASVLMAMIYLYPGRYGALLFLALSAVSFPLTSGAIFSAIQSLVNERMRSVALALIFLMANLIGFGLGPWAIGILSDLLAPRFGQESLRYALAAFSPGFLWVAYYYWKASGTIAADIQMVESVAAESVIGPVKVKPSEVYAVVDTRGLPQDDQQDCLQLNK